MDDRLNILLIKHTNNAKNSCIGGKKSQKMKLSDYRKEILLPANELFAQKNGTEINAIDIVMQGDYVIADIAILNKETKKYEIHIKVQNNNGLTEKESKQEKIAKFKVNKVALQGIIKEVDQFQAERKISHNKAIADQEAKLEKIRKNIKEIMPKFKDLDVTKDMEVIQGLLKRQNLLSDALLREYQEDQSFTVGEMVKRFKDQICKSLNPGKNQPLQTLVDVTKSQFSEIANYNDNGYQKRTLKQQTEARKASLNLDSFKNQVSLNAVGFTVGGFMKAGFDLAVGSQSQCSIAEMVKRSSFSNLVLAVSFKTAYHVEPADIVVTQNFKQAFHDVFNIYAAEKEKVTKSELTFDKLKQIKQRIKDLIKRFGSQIEVGSYVFGSRFKAIQSYTFQASLSQQKRENICNIESNLTLKGAGIGSVVAFGGSAEVDMSVNSGNSEEKQKKSKGYSISRQYYSTPPIIDYYKWLQAIEYNMKHWTLQYSHTQRVPVGRIMQNPKNKKNLKDQKMFFFGFCQLFDNVANDNLRQNGVFGKKDILSEIICVVGKLGQGKSTFINQMVGISLDKPCVASSQVKGETSEVKSYAMSSNTSSIQTTIIDTPGIFDNMGRGKNMREKIINIVYSDGKDGKIKYVDAIVMIVKVTADSRLQIGKQLEEIESIFGNQIYESLLIIINFPTYNVYESKFKVCLDVEDVKRIKTLKNTKFDLNNQVFYNVLQDPDTPQYRAHQREILKRVRSLKIFTSKDYEQGAMEREKAIRAKNQQILKQKQGQKMKEQVLNYINNRFVGCTIRYPINGVMYHLDLGVIKRTIYWIPTQRGYDLWKERSRLSLSYRKVDYENGIIQCKLSATAEAEKFLVRNDKQDAQGLLGWNSTGDTICIQFLKGSKGLINFCFANLPEEVHIRFKDTLPKKYIRRNPEWEQYWNSFYYRTGYGIVHSEKASIFTIIRDV